MNFDKKAITTQNRIVLICKLIFNAWLQNSNYIWIRLSIELIHYISDNTRNNYLIYNKTHILCHYFRKRAKNC